VFPSKASRVNPTVMIEFFRAFIESSLSLNLILAFLLEMQVIQIVMNPIIN
jgi:hypothetical protein